MEMNKDMEEKKIRVLLEKYFDGATSLEEERTLKTYFGTAKYVPEDMEYARMMFGFFTDALQSEESQTGSLSSGDTATESVLKTAPKRGIAKKMVYWAASCAAVVMIALFAGLSINDYMDGKKEYCYVNGKLVTDEELVMQYTMDAMNKISTSFDLGLSTVESIDIVDRTFNEDVMRSIEKIMEEEGLLN